MVGSTEEAATTNQVLLNICPAARSSKEKAELLKDQKVQFFPMRCPLPWMRSKQSGKLIGTVQLSMRTKR